jgi:hypothetical protein
MNRQARSVRGLIIVATIATVVALAPIWAGGTPSDQLFMPQGSAAGTANGDYLSTPTGSGGVQLPYRYWIEVPAGASRLVVDLYDPDWGAGGTTEAASNRDRDRGGTTFGGVSTYSHRPRRYDRHDANQHGSRCLRRRMGDHLRLAAVDNRCDD